MKKLWWLLSILGVAGLLFWQGVKGQPNGTGSAAGRRNAAVAVSIEAVQRDSIRDVGTFTGSLEPQSKFVVAPKVSGWLKELLVDVGDTVKRNQVIAVLDDEEFVRQSEQAKAELLVAQANAENSASALDVAKREYERSQALRDKQIASAAELDESAATFNARQAQLKVSQAQVAQRQAAYEAAQLRLSYTQVKAFWQGGSETRVVGERFVDEGSLLQVNQPIVSVLQNDPLTAVVYVIERDYPKVRLGQQAVITADAYPTQTFPGTITRIAPLLQESSRQARVEIEVSNSEHQLKPGMFVRAEVEFSRHSAAQLIPRAALVRRNSLDGVFLADLEHQKARFVPVTPGIMNNQVVEILSPKLEGDVITMGNHLLEDGSSILLPSHGSESQPVPQEKMP